MKYIITESQFKLIQEKEKSKKDLSQSIKELLMTSVVPKYEDVICQIIVIPPWKSISINPNHEEYEIMVRIVGGVGSKRWPQTQSVYEERERIREDIYETVYNYLGVKSSILTRNVKSCEEFMNESELEKEQKVLSLPNVDYFGGWDGLQKYLAAKNNPPYSIEGELNLADSNVISLGNLVSVKGNLHLNGSKIESLGNLTYVGGHLVLSWTKLKSLGNLIHVGGDADLMDSKLESLGNLTRVDRDLMLNDTKKLKSLGNLTSVGRDVILTSSKVKSLGNLIEVGGMLELFNSNVKNLGNLISVGGNLNAYMGELEGLGNLTSVGGDLDLKMTDVLDFGNLKKVGGNLDLGGCKILFNYKSPKKIRSIVDVGGNIKMKV
jgi:hypothetical protein